MSTITTYAPGTFCWAELATTDVEAAKQFYTTMFGWSVFEAPMPDGVYTMFLSGGNYAAAAYPSPAGVPTHWATYFSVASADETAAKVEALGGKVLMPPFDVPSAGRMTVIQDPQGATFAIWQAGNHIGATHGGPLGMFTWPELATPDPAGSVAFYSGLFGWKTKPESGFDTAPYVEWINGEAHIGGLMPMRGEMWQGVPPHWMLYVTVADCDADAAKVASLGGRVRVPPTDIPNVGRFSVVSDPQGATFSLIQMAGARASA